MNNFYWTETMPDKAEAGDIVFKNADGELEIGVADESSNVIATANSVAPKVNYVSPTADFVEYTGASSAVADVNKLRYMRKGSIYCFTGAVKPAQDLEFDTLKTKYLIATIPADHAPLLEQWITQLTAQATQAYVLRLNENGELYIQGVREMDGKPATMTKSRKITFSFMYFRA